MPAIIKDQGYSMHTPLLQSNDQGMDFQYVLSTRAASDEPITTSNTSVFEHNSVPRFLKHCLSLSSARILYKV